MWVFESDDVQPDNNHKDNSMMIDFMLSMSLFIFQLTEQRKALFT